MELRLNLPISEIYYHPQNPRKVISDIDELAASIKANGILQNLTVVPGHWESEESFLPDGYTVIIGHRRLTAARQAGLYEVPCTIVEMDLPQQIQTMLLENMQRSDLTIYEEAHGFQMLLDFGNSIEEISQKSGFSQTTVRRRIKMMELDQEKLKEVSVRQIPITDFDELAKIEDIDERNKVLEVIGTNDFKFYLKDALRTQNIQKNRKFLETYLQNRGIKKIEHDDTYSRKFIELPKRINLSDDIDDIQIPEFKLAEGEKLYYCLLPYGAMIFFKMINIQKDEPKQSPEAIALNKKIRSSWGYITNQSKLFYELRKQFIDKLSYSSKNESKFFQGAITAGLQGIADQNTYRAQDALKKILDIDISYYGEQSENLVNVCRNIDKNKLPQIVYSMFCDDEQPVICGSTYLMPVYKPRNNIILLYDWLKSLGYEMSTAEKDLLYGMDSVYSSSLNFEGE